jgi:acetolactate synthase-1/2/3 large subunit
MEGRLLGESPKTGLWCPDSLDIAKAYKIKGIRISSAGEVDKKIKEVLDYNGPVICDVVTPKWQLIIPRIASEKKPDGTLVSKPYEDLFPFLEKEELDSNMIAKIQTKKVKKL